MCDSSVTQEMLVTNILEGMLQKDTVSVLPVSCGRILRVDEMIPAPDSVHDNMTLFVFSPDEGIDEKHIRYIVGDDGRILCVELHFISDCSEGKLNFTHHDGVFNREHTIVCLDNAPIGRSIAAGLGVDALVDALARGREMTLGENDWDIPLVSRVESMRDIKRDFRPVRENPAWIRGLPKGKKALRNLKKSTK